LETLQESLSWKGVAVLIQRSLSHEGKTAATKQFNTLHLTNKATHKQTNKQTNKQKTKNKPTNKQTNKQTKTNKQTIRHKNTHVVLRARNSKNIISPVKLHGNS